ncbi:MAG: transglycosylase family protein [Actinomycetota bacterium]
MVSHTYPPLEASPKDGQSPVAASPSDAIAPAVPAPARRRVALVEDRLKGDRRNLPAPPSHRSTTQAPPRETQPAAEQPVPDPADSDLTAPLPAGRGGLSPLTNPRPADAGSGDQEGKTVAGRPPLAIPRKKTLLPPPVRPDGFDGLPLHDDLDGPVDDMDRDPYRDPYVESEGRRLPLGSRLARGGLVLGLLGAVGALMFATPDDGGGTTVQAAAAAEPAVPFATAEMLDNSSLDSVDVSLGASESLASMASAVTAGRIGTPADTASGFASAVAEVVEEATAPETTTTTVFVEPTLPPESEWIDAGNGVPIPDVLLRIRFCESTNNYLAANSYSSARGAYQFLTKSWDWYGHAEITGVTQAHLATPAQQDEAALRTLQAEGTGPWSESRACWNSPDIAPNYATAPPPTTPAPTTTVPDGETTTIPEGETTTTAGETTTTTAPGTETTVDGGDTTVPETTTTTAAPTDGGEETTTTQP